jgi:hypothetical protein
MAYKFEPAKSVAQDRGNGEFWIDHAIIDTDDCEWLAEARILTLWNVKFSPDLWSKLTKLWWLDLRGGSANDLDHIRSATQLRYFRANQIRGLSDLSAIEQFTQLIRLDIYGLPRVQQLPNLSKHFSLRYLDVGQMSGIQKLDEIFLIPNLKELFLVNRVPVTKQDALRIATHPTLESFAWSSPDWNVKMTQFCQANIKLPRPSWDMPDAWFAKNGLVPAL